MKILKSGKNTIIKQFLHAPKVITKSGNQGLTGKQQVELANMRNSKSVQIAKAISGAARDSVVGITGAKAAERITSNKTDAAALASYLNVIRGGEGGGSGSESTTEVGGSGSKLGG